MAKVFSIGDLGSSARSEAIERAQVKRQNKYSSPTTKRAIKFCALELNDYPERIARKLGTPGRRGPVSQDDCHEVMDVIYESILEEIQRRDAVIAMQREAIAELQGLPTPPRPLALRRAA